MQKVIISVLGKDSPGILAAISRTLLELDCNLENISQTILQSVFGAVLIVSIPKDTDTTELRQALLKSVVDFGLDIYVKPFDALSPASQGVTQPFILTTVGPDNKGLVAGITGVLSTYNINITNLKAIFKGGADPGDNIMIFEVDVPDSVDVPSVVKDLEECSNRLGLDINIQHRKIFETMNRI